MEKKDLKFLFEQAIGELFYRSETDSSFSFFQFEKCTSVDAETIRKHFKLDGTFLVEERSFDEFFTRLTQVKSWFGESEKNIAARFNKLKELMEAKLTGIRVFRFGRIKIDIYIVGLDSEGCLAGIRTTAVET